MTNKNITSSYADDIFNPITDIEDLYQGQINDQEYDLLVFIGRFQPLHLGHKRVIDIALRKSKKVLILVGSAFRPRRPRNPWLWDEREIMIRANFDHTPTSKLIIRPLEDFTYRDELWMLSVQSIVKEVVQEEFKARRGKKIGLIGCSKDSSSYYLKLFPQWGNVNVRFLNPLNATQLREEYFNNTSSFPLQKFIDSKVLAKMNEFKNHPEFSGVKEYTAVVDKIHRERQAGARYPIQDMAADSLVTQSGHLLVVRRGGAVGRGLLAMPGGYVNPDETFLQASIRELREETRLKVPEPVLRGSIAASFDADHPYRSERGRIFSKVFHFKLNDQVYLPDVRGPALEVDSFGHPIVEGADDAAAAFWIPFSEVNSEEFFEDHFDIISKMLGL